MAYCRNCGTEINDMATVCPNCGAVQTPQGASYDFTPSPIQQDNGGILWGLLGFFVPLVGFILWLVWKDQKPKTSKAVGIGALISVGISIICYLFVIILSVGLVIFGL